MRKYLPTIILLSLLVAGCGASELTPETPAPTMTHSAPTPLPPSATSQPAGDQSLDLWVPAFMDPAAENPAAEIFSARLLAFQASHPGSQINIRLKAPTGAGGLFAALQAATAAAPDVLPDLIVLGPDDLDQASQQGIIRPLGEFFPDVTLDAFYPHTARAFDAEGNLIGMPIASDILLLGYRASLYPSMPRSWSDLLSGTTTFLFPAGDPLAHFTLLQYRDLGGTFERLDGTPGLDQVVLLELFNYYAALREYAVLPRSSLSFLNNQDTWTSFKSNRVTAASTWLSDYLVSNPANGSGAAPLPSRSGEGIAPAFTWSWALVSQDPTEQALCTELLEWLSEAQFLAEWTHAVGLLPASSRVYAGWPDDASAITASHLVQLAQPDLPASMKSSFGAAMAPAVGGLISGSLNSEQAVQSVIEALAAQ